MPNATRYAALARLLLRHGRSDLVKGAGLDEFGVEEFDSPQGDEPGSVDRAERLAADLEELGPTYIKLGQLLSTRFDLLPAAYTTALARLQDTVGPFPVEQAREIIEADFGIQVRHLFPEFDDTPMAAASLGQVHRARLRSGRDVVVKIQRPGVREAVRDDMEVLDRLASFAQSRTDIGKRFGAQDLLAQFRRSLSGELDYRREARNLLQFRSLTAGYDRLVVPEPVNQLTSSRVLTMDFVPGRRVTDIGKLGMLDVDGRPIVEQLFACYLRMILDAGVLHADPHPGNVLYTDDARLALIDLGMVAHVPRRIRDQLVKLLVAIGDGEGEEAATFLAGMGTPLEDYDAANFRDDVAHLVSDSVAAGADVQAGTVLMEMTRISGARGLRPPPEMSMVGKALLNLDQVTSHLDPTFAPAESIRDNVGQILASGLAPTASGLVAAAIEAKEFTAQLPRRANRIMDAVASGQLTLRVHALDERRLHTVLQRVANRVTMGLVLASIVVGAALMMQIPTSSTLLGYPSIAMVFFLAAAVAGAALVLWILVTDRRVAAKRRDRPPRGDAGI